MNVPPPEAPKARTLRDATRVSGLSRSFFYKLEKEGRVTLIRVGGRTLIAEAELNRLLGISNNAA